jgi:hypothetical protein
LPANRQQLEQRGCVGADAPHRPARDGGGGGELLGREQVAATDPVDVVADQHEVAGREVPVERAHRVGHQQGVDAERDHDAVGERHRAQAVSLVDVGASAQHGDRRALPVAEHELPGVTLHRRARPVGERRGVERGAALRRVDPVGDRAQPAAQHDTDARFERGPGAERSNALLDGVHFASASYGVPTAAGG